MAGISRRGFLVGAAASAGAAALVSACSGDEGDDAGAGQGEEAGTTTGPQPRGSAPEGALNVIYVTADDLGTTIGAYGDTQVISPNIDAFAERALLFERCYAQIAICTASRTSILTGTRPETTGLIDLEHDWQETLPDARSLPRTFLDQGYRTASVGKVFDPRGGEVDDCWTIQREEWGVTDEVEAVAVLEEVADQPEPFFLAVGFTQPHCKWSPDEASLSQYDIASIEPMGPGRTFDAEMRECAGAGADVVSDSEVKGITARYLAEVTQMDTAFGKLMARIDELGLFESSIVIFWSGDHGFHLGQNGRWGKWSCYTAATHVPLVMSVPGRTTAGTRAPGVVECVDMYPTLVDLCGLEPPPQELEGLSFAPVVDDPGGAWKHAAFTVWGLWGEITEKAVTTPTYNHIDFLPRPLAEGHVELYDLVADPREEHDVAAEQPDVVAVLAGKLEEGPSTALPDAPPYGV